MEVSSIHDSSNGRKRIGFSFLSCVETIPSENISQLTADLNRADNKDRYTSFVKAWRNHRFKLKLGHSRIMSLRTHHRFEFDRCLQ
jgi:hypothetical protein